LDRGATPLTSTKLKFTLPNFGLDELRSSKKLIAFLVFEKPKTWEGKKI